MFRQMTVVAVMALNATDEPRMVQLTTAAMTTTKSAALTGIMLTPLTLRKHHDPGKMLSREIANVTRCADRRLAVVAQVQSIQFMTRMAVAPRRPTTWTRNSAQLFAYVAAIKASKSWIQYKTKITVAMDRIVVETVESHIIRATVLLAF